MPYTRQYTPETISRDDVDQSEGPMVIEFGTNWCGHCQAAQSAIENVMAGQPDIQHVKVEDGKGRRLGRTFGVKLWPTLIFVKSGEEVTRLVRPGSSSDVEVALTEIKEG